MLVTQEDPGNASTSLSYHASTPSFVASVVGRSASAAPSVGLEGVAKRVADYSMDNKGSVCGLCRLVWSLGPTTP